jgi:hypothetical protein
MQNPCHKFLSISHKLFLKSQYRIFNDRQICRQPYTNLMLFSDDKSLLHVCRNDISARTQSSFEKSLHPTHKDIREQNIKFVLYNWNVCLNMKQMYSTHPNKFHSPIIPPHDHSL